MALIKCLDCGREMSSDASKCPNCGKPNRSNATQGVGCLLVLLSAVVFYAVNDLAGALLFVVGLVLVAVNTRLK